MRKGLIVVLVALFAAAFFAGCETTVNGGVKIDTQAFFPNDQGNYWTYYVTGGTVNYHETLVIIDDPGYRDGMLLAYDWQRMRVWNDVENDGPDEILNYIDVTIEDNEKDTLGMIGLELYENGSRKAIHFWDHNPYVMLEWDDYGMRKDDSWDAWQHTGFRHPWFWGLPDGAMDTLGMDLRARVVDTETFSYNGTAMTAYVIEVTGTAIFERNDQDSSEWSRYPWQRDYYFVPEFGYVKIQSYTESYGQMIPSTLNTLVETNVPVPGN